MSGTRNDASWEKKKTGDYGAWRGRGRGSAVQALGEPEGAQDSGLARANGDPDMSEPIAFDPVSRAALHVIEQLGYTVEVSREGETYKFTATHPAEGSQTSGDGRAADPLRSRRYGPSVSEESPCQATLIIAGALPAWLSHA